MRELTSLLAASAAVTSPRHPMVHARANGAEAREKKRLIGDYVRRLSKVADSCDVGDGDGPPDPCVCCSKAVQLLEEMREQELPITSHARVTAMRACAEGRLDVVEELFSGLVADGDETEASYAVLIDARVAHGELASAAQALDALLVDARLTPKLRSCSPLITGLCETGTMDETAVGLWERLARRGVEFTPLEYKTRMRMHARSGAVGQLSACLTELLERYPAPDASTVVAIESALRDCAAARLVVHHGAAADSSEVEAARNDAVRIDRIDEAGQCCGTRLRLLGLNADERERVREVIIERASHRSPYGLEHLIGYREWLRVRPPFDYVLDGPNIAYLDQNYENGRFRYFQIQLVLDQIRAADPDARVLILLPQKYLKQQIPNHTCAPARYTELDASDWALINQWRADGLLYDCYAGLYDDWYWMYASVAETRAAEPGPDADLSKTQVPRVVTNDAMRDHWSELLPERSFRRWRHSQIAACGLTYPKRVAPDEVLDELGLSDEGLVAHVTDEEYVDNLYIPHGIDGEGGEAVDSPLPAPLGAADGVEVVAAAPAEVAAAVPAGDEVLQPRVFAHGAWVASPPLLSIEAQRSEGGQCHVPIPLEDGETFQDQRWLCFTIAPEVD